MGLGRAAAVEMINVYVKTSTDKSKAREYILHELTCSSEEKDSDESQDSPFQLHFCMYVSAKMQHCSTQGRSHPTA